MKQKRPNVVIEINGDAIDKRAKIVSSRIAYKIKVESGQMETEASLCFHGNEETFKNTVRKNSTCARFKIFWMTLSLPSILSIRLVCVARKCATLQSGTIQIVKLVCSTTYEEMYFEE